MRTFLIKLSADLCKTTASELSLVFGRFSRKLNDELSWLVLTPEAAFCSFCTLHLLRCWYADSRVNATLPQAGKWMQAKWPFWCDLPKWAFSKLNLSKDCLHFSKRQWSFPLGWNASRWTFNSLLKPGEKENKCQGQQNTCFKVNLRCIKGLFAVSHQTAKFLNLMFNFQMQE